MNFYYFVFNGRELRMFGSLKGKIKPVRYKTRKNIDYWNRSNGLETDLSVYNS